MTPSTSISPAATQVARLKRFGATRSVDVHCHCLPSLDDGPATMADAVALCKLLVRDGFTDVIATPHQLGRWDGTNWAVQVRQRVADLQAELMKQRVPLRIHPGGEIRIDERIPQMLENDQLLTLADTGDYVLLELPTMSMVTAGAVANVLSSASAHVILAHAERYDVLRRDPNAAEAWLETGVMLQVNAPSLLGDAPAGSREAAIHWISQGWVALVATDAHNVDKRRPRMTEAIEFLEQSFGPQIARQLCITNPGRVLERE